MIRRFSAAGLTMAGVALTITAGAAGYGLARLQTSTRHCQTKCTLTVIAALHIDLEPTARRRPPCNRWTFYTLLPKNGPQRPRGSAWCIWSDNALWLAATAKSDCRSGERPPLLPPELRLPLHGVRLGRFRRG
jgi:hypothetical protein